MRVEPEQYAHPDARREEDEGRRRPDVAHHEDGGGQYQPREAEQTHDESGDSGTSSVNLGQSRFSGLQHWCQASLDREPDQPADADSHEKRQDWANASEHVLPRRHPQDALVDAQSVGLGFGSPPAEIDEQGGHDRDVGKEAESGSQRLLQYVTRTGGRRRRGRRRLRGTGSCCRRRGLTARAGRDVFEPETEIAVRSAPLDPSARLPPRQPTVSVPPPTFELEPLSPASVDAGELVDEAVDSVLESSDSVDVVDSVFESSDSVDVVDSVLDVPDSAGGSGHSIDPCGRCSSTLLIAW